MAASSCGTVFFFCVVVVVVVLLLLLLLLVAMAIINDSGSMRTMMTHNNMSHTTHRDICDFSFSSQTSTRYVKRIIGVLVSVGCSIEGETKMKAGFRWGNVAPPPPHYTLQYDANTLQSAMQDKTFSEKRNDHFT